MKKCNKCGKVKTTDNFGIRDKKKKYLQPYCKECRKNIDKELYDSNRTQKKIKNKLRTRRHYDVTSTFIRRVKKQSQCNKCGENRWYLLDFHHIRDKKYSISSMKALSINSIKEEIRKCEVLCANCHREAHFLENIKDISL